ncbi:hypothetical protein V7138_23105 [Bacillus sp. JJ1533]|uniref:hypothetical protein n=1 Tax=Bacillus sp. JJ1533 TaxID=3122959 RepID=UPI002FFEC95A
MIQAFIASVMIHFIYFVCTVGIGYIKTKFFNPDISSEWEKVEYLQNEVVFGMVISPFIFVYSLVGITIICGIIIYPYKKFLTNGAG